MRGATTRVVAATAWYDRLACYVFVGASSYLSASEPCSYNDLRNWVFRQRFAHLPSSKAVFQWLVAGDRRGIMCRRPRPTMLAAVLHYSVVNKLRRKRLHALRLDAALLLV